MVETMWVLRSSQPLDLGSRASASSCKPTVPITWAVIASSLEQLVPYSMVVEWLGQAEKDFSLAVQRMFLTAENNPLHLLI